MPLPDWRAGADQVPRQQHHEGRQGVSISCAQEKIMSSVPSSCISRPLCRRLMCRRCGSPTNSRRHQIGPVGNARGRAFRAHPVHAHLLHVLAVYALADRQIVDHHVARDALQRCVAFDEARTPADHHAQLQLPVHGADIGRQRDRVVGADHGRIGLHEESTACHAAAGRSSS
jgi:hypothetical protein